MAVREVIRMGHPVLRQVARQLSLSEISSAEIKQLRLDLIETMHAYGGVGIAAPQVGESIAMAMLEIKQENPRYGVNESFPLTTFINPVITVLTEEKLGFWEGCLSVPDLRGYVERPRKIKVDFFNERGEKCQVIAEDFLAIVFQHELDHLFGKLYVDHITDMKKLSFATEFEKYIRPQS